MERNTSPATTPDPTPQERFDAALSRIKVSPARLAWAREVLDVFAATGSAATAVASAPEWPAS